MSQLTEIRKQVRKAISKRIFKICTIPPWANRRLTQVGTSYGGWSIPVEQITPSWVCYTAGVGEDASFDIALAEMGCEVVAIDPTPRAVDYITPLLSRHENLVLAPYALWRTNGDVDFFPPANPDHVSHSISNVQHTGSAIQVPARTLDSIAQEYGHDTVDLLKLDIEGAEYAVLRSTDLGTLGIRVLCVEFHDDVGLRRMLAAVREVRRRGFSVGRVRNTDVTFIAHNRG